MRSYTVDQLASMIYGRVHGFGDRMIHGAGTLDEAEATDISFLENEKHLRAAKASKAGCLLVTASCLVKLRAAFADPPFVCIEVADPLQAFVAVVKRVFDLPLPAPPGIDSAAKIHPSAVIGPGCRIMAFVTIAEGCTIGARCHIHPGVVLGSVCQIGDDVILHPNVVLYERTIVGNRTIIHANTVLGADGFGYRFQGNRHVKVPQLGHVEIGEDVEIGACSTIDRGTFKPTRIGSGTKIDNLVMVAHNVRVGPHNLIVSQVGIAGSSQTGSHVVVAGQAGISDHVTVGDGVTVGAGAGVHHDIPAGQRLFGFPARPEREARRIFAGMAHLPNLIQDVRAIKRRLGMITSTDEQTDPAESLTKEAG